MLSPHYFFILFKKWQKEERAVNKDGNLPAWERHLEDAQSTSCLCVRGQGQGYGGCSRTGVCTKQKSSLQSRHTCRVTVAWRRSSREAAFGLLT